MSLEIITAIAVLTFFRVAWILSRPVPGDVKIAHMPGLANTYKILKRDRNYAYLPYGVIWYAVNYPLSRVVKYDGISWMVLLALIDSLFIWLSQQLGFYGLLSYVLIGTFQLLRAPWNVSILWLTILGLFQWWFLIVAPIAKLPVGLPRQAWENTRVGLFHQHNFVYYGLLVTLWVVVFINLYIPSLLEISITVLGILWSLVLGYLYRKKLRINAQHLIHPLL